MLPHIVAKNRRLAIGDGVVLVGRRHDGQLAAAVLDKPNPTGTETGDARRVELLFEIVERAKGIVDGVEQRAGW